MGRWRAFGPSVPGKLVLKCLRTTGVSRVALWLFQPHAPAMTMI